MLHGLGLDAEPEFGRARDFIIEGNSASGVPPPTKASPADGLGSIPLLICRCVETDRIALEEAAYVAADSTTGADLSCIFIIPRMSICKSKLESV